MTPELRFDGRVAIITGAAGGLGAAHARLLAERGAIVVVNDLAAAQAGSDALVADIINGGGTAVGCIADVSREAGAGDLVEFATERFGRVDILINNAGRLRSGPFGETTSDVFDEVLAANLRSAYLVTHAAWSVMTTQGYGRVLSTTSNSGLLGTAGSTAYAMAKAGLWGLTRSLALEGARLGINVNAIAPIAYTAMSQQSKIAPPAWRSGEGDAWSARLDPGRVAPAAAWLVHRDCAVNGEVWSVAGGRVARFLMGLTDGYVSADLTIERVRDRADELYADGSFSVLPRAADEGRNLHRRILG